MNNIEFNVGNFLQNRWIIETFKCGETIYKFDQI